MSLASERRRRDGRTPHRRQGQDSSPASDAAVPRLRNTTSPVGKWTTRISWPEGRVKLLAASATAYARSLTR